MAHAMTGISESLLSVRCSACREGEPGAMWVYLGYVRFLIRALGSMASEMAGVIVGYPDERDRQDV